MVRADLVPAVFEVVCCSREGCPMSRKESLQFILMIAEASPSSKLLVSSPDLLSKLVTAYRHSPEELVDLMLSLAKAKIRTTRESDLLVLVPLLCRQFESAESPDLREQCYELLLESLRPPASRSPSSSGDSPWAGLQTTAVLSLARVLKKEGRNPRQALALLHSLLVLNSCPIPVDALPSLLTTFTSALARITALTSPHQRTSSDLDLLCPCLSRVVMATLEAQLSPSAWAGEAEGTAATQPLQWLIDSGPMAALLERQTSRPDLMSVADCVLKAAQWAVENHLAHRPLLDHLTSSGLLLFVEHLIKSNSSPNARQGYLSPPSSSDPATLSGENSASLLSLTQAILRCDAKYAQEMKQLKLSRQANKREAGEGEGRPSEAATGRRKRPAKEPTKRRPRGRWVFDI
jgi:hypothetical protein